MTPLQTISKRLGLLEELGPEVTTTVPRPIAFCYDFLEVFSGASTVSRALDALGFVVGPPVDLSISEEYNMEWVRVVSWITFMLAAKRLCSVMCEPPCTSFSIMRRPPLRSRLCPYGFSPRNQQTYLGNLLLCRSLQILRVALINGACAILESPFSALTKHLPPYAAFLKQPGASMCRTDSCMFGSTHLKAFRFLAANLDLSLGSGLSALEIISISLCKVPIPRHQPLIPRVCLKPWQKLLQRASCDSKVKLKIVVRLLSRVWNPKQSILLPSHLTGRSISPGRSVVLLTSMCWNFLF